MLLAALLLVAGVAVTVLLRLPVAGVPLVILAILVPQSLMIVDQWEKAIVLRLGRLRGIKGPGWFVIIPFIDRISVVIDQRIQTTEINAEQALTKDTVPVGVDAIVFWQVHDAERAALEITDYTRAIQRVAQTSLRETIGASQLSTLLSERRAADERLREVIGAKTKEWGVSCLSVEIRDVAIPIGLQDAMSRQAQAEREKEARIILGSAEAAVAEQFLAAARTYAGDPAALQLRAMNIIYETTKERGATILMPTTMVDAMNPAVAVALNQAAKAG
jgi:regulator of protease activity HflC (stomatin/prohibitin superfamily)